MECCLTFRDSWTSSRQQSEGAMSSLERASASGVRHGGVGCVLVVLETEIDLLPGYCQEAKVRCPNALQRPGWVDLPYLSSCAHRE